MGDAAQKRNHSTRLADPSQNVEPVEHLAALRAMPNMRVFRPCDAVETSEAWEIALTRADGPTVLVLTRQNLPQFRLTDSRNNRLAEGAYELAAGTNGAAKVTLFASGSEVEIAMTARAQLAEKGICARVVSVPSLELFLAQPDDVKARVIGKAPIKIAIEAGVRFGWDALVGPEGGFVGMSSFGASAPYKELYKHFGITAEAVVVEVMKRHNG